MKHLLFLIVSFFITTTGTGFAAPNYVFFSPEMIHSHLASYTDNEKEKIEKDLTVIRDICFEKVQESNTPIYLATAGAPGSRKSTILERLLRENPRFSNMVYIDPDQRALKFMSYTYYSQSLTAFDLGVHPNCKFVQRAAYERWRGASNYITLTLLEEALNQQCNLAHGTTSTGGHIFEFLPAIKKAGYEICLLLCSCEDFLRYDSIEYRNEMQRFYQSTPEDAVKKGSLFPRRMQAYFIFADELQLFWSDDLFEKERLAAILKNGQLSILDQEAYLRFQDKYESDRKQLKQEGVSLLSWKELLNLYTSH